MPARRVALYVRAGGSNTPRGWLSFAVFSIPHRQGSFSLRSTML